MLKIVVLFFLEREVDGIEGGTFVGVKIVKSFDFNMLNIKEQKSQFFYCLIKGYDC